LSPAETQSLQDEKRELEATVREIEQEGAGDGRVDLNKIRTEISRLDNIIGDRTPTRVSGSQKDKLHSEEKSLEASIALGMPTRDEMARPTKNPGAVRKHMEWCKRNQNAIKRYVQIQRELRPNEPKSIEVLRREK
jgi:hypothetical protein